jgi:hypothetical protein
MNLRLALNFCIFSQILGAFYALRHAPNFYEIHPWGQFLVHRELSAIFDAHLFPTFLKPNSWAPFSWLLRPTFNRALWTIEVNFLVKKLGAVALNYLYIQEIDPWCNLYQSGSQPFLSHCLSFYLMLYIKLWDFFFGFTGCNIVNLYNVVLFGFTGCNIVTL